jgi:dolichol-phosphate mannosyltransferase
MESIASPVDSLGRPSMIRPEDVTVIIPTYNEVDNLESISAAARSHGYRVLVVDDGSPDGTGDLADALSGADVGLDVLHRTEKAGLGKAYAAGFAYAIDHGAHVMCEMDADFSHDPADLPRLIAAIDDGADVAIGSRYIRGGGADDWPWYRRAISRAGNDYAALLLDLDVRDTTAGFRAYTAEAIKELDPGSCDASGYAFQVEMTWRAELAGLIVTEVPIRFRDRELGTSKMSGAIAVEAMTLITKWGLARRLGPSRQYAPRDANQGA